MKSTKYLITTFKPLTTTLSIIVLLTACSGKKETDEDLKKAFKLHQEAVEIRKMTEDQLTKVPDHLDSLSKEAYENDLDSLKLSLKAWDEQLIEVPGFEEEHDHSEHDHHHHHDEVPELNPKQHLEVQQHLLDEIKAIAKNVDQLQKK